MVHQHAKSVSTGEQLPNFHAEGDADVLIVKTAVESVKERDTVFVRDDIDSLIYCGASTPAQIALTFISIQNQRQTPEDDSGT